MAPDKRLDRPEDGSLSPATEDATAPAAQTPELGPEPPPPPSHTTRRDPGRRGRERSWELSPQEAAPKETRCPPPPHTHTCGSRVVVGGTFHGDAGGGGSGAERGAPVTTRAPPDPFPPKEGGRGGREGPTGKAKPGKRCSENKAGLSKADTDTDTQAQEQERKRRRHSDPQQEKTKLNLGRDRDQVQRHQTQACAGAWGKCT